MQQRPGMQQQMQNMSGLRPQAPQGQLAGNIQQQHAGVGQMMAGGGLGGINSIGLGNVVGGGGPVNQMNQIGGSGVPMNNLGQLGQIGLGGSNQINNMSQQQQQQVPQQMVNPNQIVMNRINVGSNAAINNTNVLTPQQQIQLAQQQQQINLNAGGGVINQQINTNAGGGMIQQNVNSNSIGIGNVGGISMCQPQQQQQQQGQMSSTVPLNINNPMSQIQQQLNNPNGNMTSNNPMAASEWI